jgi:seryl-tRNA synthetase
VIPIQELREDPGRFRDGARRKGEAAPIDEILELDTAARQLRARVESAQAERRRESSAIRGAPSPDQQAQLGALKESIQAGEARLAEMEARLRDLLLAVPNPPHESVPVGADESGNLTVRTWGQAPSFDFTPLAHYELGERMGIFDFERAAKVSGARFAVLRGDGARLQRALITWMLDVATREHGYTEVLPPYLVRTESMVGTANLPDKEGMAYQTSDDLYLIPTAEVPVTNLYRDEILDAALLPICHVAYSACFRREAGAAGKDTRGYVRLHQFDKVEMVRFVTPDSSLDQLEVLTGHAESLLQRLGLHHRVLLMCSGDLGFAQWKKYDLEAWAPGMGRFLEVSSCSVFGEFQARRINIRYRPAPGERPRFVHTLNGSGLAVPRVLDAILETYQREDGGVVVPEVLRPYLGGMATIGPG